LINHLNVLRTVEDMYALPYAGGSATASPILNIWAATPPTDLNWTGGSVTAPASATTTGAFTVSRTYNVSGNAAPRGFTIGYYQSASPPFAASAVRIGREVVSGAAALTTGTHAGTSPPLVITAPGSYYLFARLDEGDLVTETNETNNVLASQ